MSFNITTDFSIFESFLAKRPEVSAEALKQDLTRYYLPFVQKLIDLKKARTDSKGLIVGVSAIQGAGKTTQGEIMEILLDRFGHVSVSRSIDDHYLTHDELNQLRDTDPRYIRRGVTHDIPLAILNLRDLQEMSNQPILTAGYDKGAHDGDGDRFRWVNLAQDIALQAQVINNALHLTSLTYQNSPINLPSRMGPDIPLGERLLPPELLSFLGQQSDLSVQLEGENAKFSGNGSITVSKKDLPNGWRLVTNKPDFIFYDGWMLGARRVEDESIFDSGLPALETEPDRQFAKDINKKLEDYEPLWSMIDFLNVLYVPNYQMSLKWRDQAEEILRAKGKGMSPDQIKEFVYYFWRSVHPAIHIKNLAKDTTHTQQVVMIDDDHSVGDILTPAQATQKLV